MATIRIPFLRNDAANATNDRFRPEAVNGRRKTPTLARELAAKPLDGFRLSQDRWSFSDCHETAIDK